ncbi:hypothetical protein BKP35_01575 [Anaerobacillus arseniciselenatis]|uniref:NAD(P)-binding domain-containing protein n=1 Tax=Anaerobacillus arseniciselenatis TaxID=85682 RepID=A0A1S2LUS3_9BACI|nr:hypothetical protein BKP35_01575 [Anaerobacillus arseniciselenatis]
MILKEEGEVFLSKTALIIGATGLVGGHLLELLIKCENYNKIVLLSRRPLPLADEKVQQHIVDFDQLDQYQLLFNDVDDVFCTLGTTMKKAKTKEQFVKIDFEYPLKVAKLAKQNGVQQFFIVTAMGANQHSRFFYNQVKGNVEAAIREVDLPALFIIRPSLILGERNEQRFGEDLGQKITKAFPFLFKGLLKKYQPNRAQDVAKAMINLALKDDVGTFVVDSSLIEKHKKNHNAYE